MGLSPSLLDDTKLCGEAEMLEKRDALTGLRAGHLWISWSSTRPSERSYTWIWAVPSTNTGWVVTRLRAALQKRTWGCWLMSSSIGSGLQPRKLRAPWDASKEAGWERWFSHSALLRPCLEYSVQFWGLQVNMDLLEVQRGKKMMRGLEKPLWRQAENLRLFSLEKSLRAENKRDYRGTF